MGKIHMGILGPLSQSVGHVTGASVKGKATLRRKSSGGVNPRTEKQVESRSAFGEASEYCREHRAEIIEYCGFREKKGLTIWNQMIRWYLDGGRLPEVGPYLRDIVLGGNTYKEVMLWPSTGDKLAMALLIPNLFDIPADATDFSCYCTEVYTPDGQSGQPYASFYPMFANDVLTLFPDSDTSVTGLPIVEGCSYVFTVQYRLPAEPYSGTVTFVLNPDNAGPGEFARYSIPTDAEIEERLSVLGTVTMSEDTITVSRSKSIRPTGRDGVAPELADLCPVIGEFGLLNFSYKAFWVNSSTLASAVSGRMSGGDAGQAMLNEGFADPVSSALKACFGKLGVSFAACLPWMFSLREIMVEYQNPEYDSNLRVGTLTQGQTALPAWLSSLSDCVIDNAGFAVRQARTTLSETTRQLTLLSLDSSALDGYSAGRQYNDSSVWYGTSLVGAAGYVSLDEVSNVAYLQVKELNMARYDTLYPAGLTLIVTHNLSPYFTTGMGRVNLEVTKPCRFDGGDD